jgi:hypothetical protein
LLLPVICHQARTADSEREWHTQQVSAFRRGGAGAGAAVRQMRRKVGLAARRVAALYAHCTLAHYSITHC